MRKIKITHVLWNGWAKFYYHKKNEPFVGIAKHKLQYAGNNKVKIELAYLKHNKVVTKDPQELIKLAEKNGWEGTNQNLECYYLPEEVLLGGTSEGKQEKLPLDKPAEEEFEFEVSPDLPF